MTQFEYIAIAYSMVLSFTVLRALSVLPDAIQSGRRYWVHTMWICLILVTILVMFWNFWLYRQIEWTLPRFALVLANPAILYVFVSLLAPEDPSTVESWQEHFYSIRLRLFLTGIAWDLSALAENLIFLDLSMVHLFNIQVGIATLAHAVGAFSERAVVQSAVVLVAFLASVLVFVGMIP